MNEFRTKMRAFCEERAQERQMLPWDHWMEYNFPCELEPCSTVTHSGKSRSVKKIFVNVKFEGSEVRHFDFSFSSIIQLLYPLRILFLCADSVKRVLLLSSRKTCKI